MAERFLPARHCNIFGGLENEWDKAAISLLVLGVYVGENRKYGAEKGKSGGFKLAHRYVCHMSQCGVFGNLS